MAALSGATGQAGYAAANGAMNAWSQCAQDQGRPSVAVQWGNWSGSGMAVHNEGFIKRMNHLGIGVGEHQGLQIRHCHVCIYSYLKQ